MRISKILRHAIALSAVWSLLAAFWAPASGQTLGDGVSVHGFMTQAFGATTQHQLIGLSPTGTADYRVAALQFRYDADQRNVMVVQFSHERLGRSPIGDAEDDVVLDWIFYEHWFDDLTVARVGRIRMPIGIYNEIRDVGTLLPFYRPPESMYGEQTYAAETVDGLMIGRRVPLGAWSLSAEAFYGSWQYLQRDLATNARVDGGLGGQLWIHTPLEGVRVGGSYVRLDASGSIDSAPGTKERYQLWRGSVEGVFSRFNLRAEYVYNDFEAGNARTYYAQAGLPLTDALSLIGQAEFRDLRVSVPAPVPLTADVPLDRDYAVGIRYSPWPTLAFKLEGHRYRGYSTEDVAPSIFGDDPRSLHYALFSVSTSF
jgi:hypothetical protein